MSLDVYLTVPDPRAKLAGSGIFVRENGATKEISRAEWDEKFPGREPIVVEPDDSLDRQAYSRNITHNLGRMAEAASIYQALWRPEEIGITRAEQLVKPLTEGLALLEADPDRFRAFNPENGWGDYDGLCDFVREYLDACIANPDAKVSASR